MKITKRQLRRIIKEEKQKLHEAKAKVPKNIRKIVMDAAKGFSEGFEVVEFRVHPHTGAWLIETAVEDPDYVVPDFVDYLSENETLSEHEINYDDWLIAIEPLSAEDDDGWDDDPEW
jgi:hypothetical protein